MMVRITADKKEAAVTQKAVAQQEQEANEQAAQVSAMSASLVQLPLINRSLPVTCQCTNKIQARRQSSHCRRLHSLCRLFVVVSGIAPGRGAGLFGCKSVAKRCGLLLTG